MGLVVSYHTGEPYKAEAGRLVRSLRALGLDYVVSEIPSRGSWRANVNAKCEIILWARLARPFTDVLYVDADAVVHSDPFEALKGPGPLGECDIAVHRFKGVECCSGTIWMPWVRKRSGHVESLLRRWDQLNGHLRNRNVPQPQAILAEALGSAGDELQVAELPASHCYIFDLSREVYPGTTPVIEHLQASRDFREHGQSGRMNGPRAARIRELQVRGERGDLPISPMRAGRAGQAGVRGENGDGQAAARRQGDLEC